MCISCTQSKHSHIQSCISNFTNISIGYTFFLFSLPTIVSFCSLFFFLWPFFHIIFLLSSFSLFLMLLHLFRLEVFFFFFHGNRTKCTQKHKKRHTIPPHYISFINDDAHTSNSVLEQAQRKKQAMNTSHTRIQPKHTKIPKRNVYVQTKQRRSN